MTLRKKAREVIASSMRVDAFFRRHIWSRLHYPEIEILKIAKLPGKPIDLAVDVGAALGSYAWVLSRKSRQVYAFEPGDHHYDFLRCGAGKSNVEVVKAAVGRKNGQGVLFSLGVGRDADHTATLSEANPLANESDVNSVEVRVVTLDSVFLAPALQGRSIDLIKVDVEGFELEVLAGAEGVILRDKPLLICEIEGRHNAQYASVFGYLSELGYSAKVYSQGKYIDVSAKDVLGMQTADALRERMSGSIRARDNRYLNNFVFRAAATEINLGWDFE